MARESWSGFTTTCAERSAVISTLSTEAGERAEEIYYYGFSLNLTMSIFSPPSSEQMELILIP